MRTKQATAGFTLIEMIVSLALFSVVITISVGALLVLIASNRQLQDEQAVLTNLSFALDSMTREIRTGSAYAVASWQTQINGGPNNPFNPSYNLDTVIPVSDVQDDADGRNRNSSGIIDNNARVHGVSFVESGDSITGGGSQRIIYFHDVTEQAIYRRFGNGDAQKITSESVAIVDADFFVTGSEPRNGMGGNVVQPTVTIYIEAQVAGATNPKTYPIQTTVVQRTLDL